MKTEKTFSIKSALVALFLLVSATVMAQVQISGVVTDGTEPVIGATIRESGTQSAAVSDMDGKFSIKVQDANAILNVSYVGYQTQTVKIAGRKFVTVVLENDETSLEDVVVVGYGTMKKKLVTGATVQVKGDDVASRNTTSALSALQNQTPGVNIVQTSGKPGAGFNVNIRGAGTNGSTAPLYVIDGVVGDINSLNPADIESIDVLKDAASSAIYGARAANGVILITTKQGKAGSIEIDYDGNVGWQYITKVPQQLTAKQWMDVMDMTNLNDGKAAHNWAAYIPAETLAAYQNGTDNGTDYFSQLYNKGAITTSHSLAVSGGNDRSKFSAGVGLQYQDGIIGGSKAPSDYTRATLRLNSEHVLLKGENDRDVITIGENLYYQHSEQKGINIGNMYSNAIYSLLHCQPIIPAYNADGTLFDGYNATDSEAGWNLLGINQYFGNSLNTILNSQDSMNKSRSHNLSFTGYVTISPIKGLTYKGLGYYKNSSSMWKGYETVYYNNTNDMNTNDLLSENMYTGWNWGMTHTLNYVFDVKKAHFDILAGTEYSREGNGMGEQLYAKASGNIFENNWDYAYLRNFSGASGSATLPAESSEQNGPTLDHSVLSYFGRLNFSYDDTYMFSAIIRADASSNFVDGKRWGYFPSFSAGWVVSNMNFMHAASSWLDFLKIRASWGQNGNENIGKFQYASTYSFGAYGQYSFDNAKNVGTTGGYPTRLANPDLKWETSEQLDLGFDAQFLNSRLNLNFDWYQKKTKDLLISVPVTAINGFDSATMNAGSVKNTGFEIALSWRDKIGSDFSYNIGVNAATNKNEVTEVNNGSGYINGGNALLSQGTTYCARMEEGQPLGYFWGYKTAGVMQNNADVQAYLDENCNGNAANSLQGTSIQPGDLKFVDVNGDGKINDDDKTNIGDPHPDWTLGLNLGFNWKFIDFNVAGYAALGQQVMHSYRRFGDGQYDNWSTNVYNYWHGEGTGNGRYPRLTAGTNTNMIQVSDIYVDDADYFRLQSVTLGFDFAKLFNLKAFSQLRLYFQAQNLWTVTSYEGMDPEQGSSIASESWVTGVDICNYPSPRTFLVGVNVKFADKKVKKAAPVYVPEPEVKIVEKIVEKPVEKIVYKEVEKKTTDVVQKVYVVTFANGKYEIENADKQLEGIPSDCEVEIVAYSSPEGNPEKNQILSEKRAEEVAKYLESKGIKVASKSAKGSNTMHSARIAIVSVR